MIVYLCYEHTYEYSRVLLVTCDEKRAEKWLSDKPSGEVASYSVQECEIDREYDINEVA